MRMTVVNAKVMMREMKGAPKASPVAIQAMTKRGNAQLILKASSHRLISTTERHVSRCESIS